MGLTIRALEVDKTGLSSCSGETKPFLSVKFAEALQPNHMAGSYWKRVEGRGLWWVVGEVEIILCRDMSQKALQLFKPEVWLNFVFTLLVGVT